MSLWGEKGDEWPKVWKKETDDLPALTWVSLVSGNNIEVAMSHEDILKEIRVAHTHERPYVELPVVTKTESQWVAYQSAIMVRRIERIGP